MKLATYFHRETEPMDYASAAEVLEAKKLFFITGMGRSGTTFLAKLLDRARNATVVHEPFAGDKAAYIKACEDLRSTEEFLRDVRLIDMAERATASKYPVYGEVNSHLRRHVSTIKRLLPATKIGLVVRNGVDVVSSILNRDTFTKPDLISNTFFLPQDLMTREEWLALSRFQKCCWYWRIENETVLEAADFVFRFEDVLASYDHFLEKVTKPLEIVPIRRIIWKQAKKKPTNATARFSADTLVENWDTSDRAYFDEVCGALMNRFEYLE